MGKLIRCSWCFRTRAFSFPLTSSLHRDCKWTHHLPVLASSPCWVTVVTSGKMLPTSLSSLLTLWSCDVLVCVSSFLSQCDRKRRVILKTWRRLSAPQLVWLQTLALIYQASVPTVWPIYCQNLKLISHSEQWRRWYSRLVLQGNSVMLRIYDKCPNWSPLSTSAGVKCENKNAGLHKLCRIRSFYWQRNDNKSTFLHDIMFSKLTKFDLGLGNMVSE